MDRLVYPFSAVVGQKQVKQALLYLAVEPRIGGVLLCGAKGTAKSTLVRALGALEGIRLLELPLNATEDMLLGGVDLETAVRLGRRAYQPGLLARANGGFLYADEVNLLPGAVAGDLLDALETGVCRVERDGVSQVCPARFALIGSMNPEEGMLRPQLLDRFGLYVRVQGEADTEDRQEIVRRILAFERDPAAFRAQWEKAERQLARRLAAARDQLSQVRVGEAEEQTACRLAQQANTAGHRAELTILHTARAIAAWAGRSYLNLEDLNEAAELALPHRRREGIPPAPAERPPVQPPETPQNSAKDQPSPGKADEYRTLPPEESERSEDRTQSRQNQQGEAPERLERGNEIYDVRALTAGSADRKARRGSGRRNKTRSATRRGRGVGDRLPQGKTEDLALSATLRAAAPYQKLRRGNGTGLVVLPSDFRAKIRESRVGADIVFAVDASGSMGAARRMKEVKDAVLSMLMDSYQKRDRVGLVVFRGNEARTVLDVTRSVELAQRELQNLPTGGRTPLAAGLTEALALLERQRRRVRESMPLLVLITDGRANFSCGGDPVDEAIRAAKRVAKAGIPAVVVDTERQFITLGLAAQVAKAMDAPCYRVEDLRARTLAQLARTYSPAG